MREAGAPKDAKALKAPLLAKKDVNVYNIHIGPGDRGPSINWSQL